MAGEPLFFGFFACVLVARPLQSVSRHALDGCALVLRKVGRGGGDVLARSTQVKGRF